MQILRRLNIGPRLLAGFGGLLVMMALLLLVAVMQMQKIHRDAQELGTNWLPSVRALGLVSAEINEVRRVALRVLVEKDSQGRAEQIKRHDHARTVGVPGAFKSYQKLISSPEEQRYWDAFLKSWAAYEALDERVFSLVKKESAEALAEAVELSIGSAGAAFLQSLDALEKNMQLNEREGTEAADRSEKDYDLALRILLAVGSLALISGLAFSLAAAHSIKAPLQEAVEVAHTIAQGDLTHAFQAQGKDEPALLLQAMSTMQARLVEIVSLVRASSDNIATGSVQISSGNNDLSQRTEEQASNLQQTAASMEQISSTVKANSDAARQASLVAQAASDAAKQGGQVVGRVVSTMEEISESSRKITDIVGVIDSIAFQTNILALNAAVEAARAGEQGRGFAVVAGEVRHLANRAATASKEIKSLITASGEKVNGGGALVKESQASIVSIVEQIQRVSALVEEISSATTEQAKGVGEIGDAIQNIDQVTQHNAALVEESATAAESLRVQAQRLTEVVSLFKLAA